MGLYEMMFGINPAGPHCLVLLNLLPTQIPRLRDCWLTEDGTQVVLLTRSGGPNRPDYEKENAALRKHPWFILDMDDEVDATYALFRFEVPKDILPKVIEVILPLNDHKRGTCLFAELTRKMDAGVKPGDDPMVARALQVGKQIFAPLIDTGLVKDDHTVIDTAEGLPGVEVFTVIPKKPKSKKRKRKS